MEVSEHTLKPTGLSQPEAAGACHGPTLQETHHRVPWDPL